MPLLNPTVVDAITLTGLRGEARPVVSEVLRTRATHLSEMPPYSVNASRLSSDEGRA